MKYIAYPRVSPSKKKEENMSSIINLDKHACLLVVK